MLRIVVTLVAAALVTAADARPTDHVPSQIQIEQFGGPLGIASADAKPMPSLALDVLKHFEGWSATAYDDAVGYCTIGYGHLIALDACAVTQLGDFAPSITELVGAQLLDEDTASARATVAELVTVDLSDEQFGALSSFVFNVGRRNFRHSTLLTLLNEGDYDLAAGEFPRWVKAGGRILPGLVSRRECEQALFAGRLRTAEDGHFDQATCVALGIASETGPLIDIETGESL